MHLEATSKRQSKIGPAFCDQRKRFNYYPTMANRKHNFWVKGGSIEKLSNQPLLTTGITYTPVAVTSNREYFIGFMPALSV